MNTKKTIRVRTQNSGDWEVSCKRSQEEMVGFALIVIIVSMILIIFLSLTLRTTQKENVESYEVESFIQSVLQYTSGCEEAYESDYLSIQKLIASCNENEICIDGKNSCDVLKITLNEITKESWKVEEGSSVKGYEMNISSERENILKFSEGNLTKNSKGSMQDFSFGGNYMKVLFEVYY